MVRACGFVLLLACVPALADSPATLPGTRPLTEGGDLSERMLDGLHRFVERKVDGSVGGRASLWKRDPSSREAYERSIRANRESFRKIIGVVDPRLPAAMERFGDDDRPALVAEDDALPGLPGALARPGGRPRRGPAARAEWARCGARSSPCPTRTRRRSRSRASSPASRRDRSSPGGSRRTAFASWSRPSSAAGPSSPGTRGSR